MSERHNNVLTTEDYRLIASLHYNPGFLLLLDYLQKQLDDLTDELGDRNLPNDEALAKLRYWQAHRKIFETLKVLPQNFDASLSPDEKQQTELTQSSSISPVELMAILQRRKAEDVNQLQ